jgi:trigger factor
VNTKINDQSATRKTLVISFDAKEVDNEHQAVVNQYCRMAQLPGFRPGKAPAAMVIKRFAKNINEEFQQKVVNEAYKAATEHETLKVAAVTKLDPGTIEVGKEASITVTVDVIPEFQVPEYAGLATQVSPIEASEQEVDAVLNNIRAERAEFKVASRPAQKGDYVKLAYEGKVEGKPIAELSPEHQVYGKVPQTWEEVEGENEGIIPSLGKQIAGLKPGDKKEITVQFPADFAPVPALAGKSAVYALEIQEIRERVLPELNDEFVKSQKADSLDALKASIRDNLKIQKEMQNRNGQRQQVIDALVAKVDFELPESLVNSETQNIFRQFVTENLRRGIKQEQLEKEKTEIVENSKKAAAQRVKSQLILGKIAEAEKITVEESDLDSFLYREAMRSGTSPDKILKDLAKDREVLRSIQRSIIFDKTVDFIVSKATVSTVPAKA